jgi:hypothetical protein
VFIVLDLFVKGMVVMWCFGGCLVCRPRDVMFEMMCLR